MRSNYPYYDRDGNPMGSREFAELFSKPLDYFRVAEDHLYGIRVSTVWLGINHEWRDDAPPLIFETMLFTVGKHLGQRRALNYEMNRYSTLAQAKAGHAWYVKFVRRFNRIEALRVRISRYKKRRSAKACVV